MLYGYAASVPQSNTSGGFDYNPVGFGSPRYRYLCDHWSRHDRRYSLLP